MTRQWNRLWYLLRGMILVMLVAGCVGAPVQEMSDARQAIQAARKAGAGEFAPDLLAKAEQFLERAEHYLERGQYSEARDNALSAKAKAQDARREAARRQEPGTK